MLTVPKQLSRAVKWLQEAKFEAKIVIAGTHPQTSPDHPPYSPPKGNHDITLDEPFYAEHGASFHNQNPQSHDTCLALLSSAPGITYLNHDSATIRLSSPSGPGTHFKVFGSPYSPRNGLWAFGYDAPAHPGAFHDLPRLWDDIPLDADVVVTHTPARTHLDERHDERRARGCEALRRQLWRVRPRLAVCGHVHDGRGAERVTWDLHSRNAAFAERAVTPWTDPGGGSTGRLALVDLTGRREPTLANDGSHVTRTVSNTTTTTPPPPVTMATSSDDDTLVAAQACSSTLGLGCDAADPDSPRCDSEALSGRMRREETCFVNAAVMKSRYPHVGGKQFYRPIVVDVDLPVWQPES